MYSMTQSLLQYMQLDAAIEDSKPKLYMICLFLFIGSNTGRCIEIGSGSIRGDLFGKRRDYTYDVPDGAIHVSLDVQDKCDAQINIGSGNGDVTLKWDKAAKKAHVHAWVNGAIGRNHFEWTVYAWL